MAGLSRSAFMAIAVVFHIIYFFAIFDIYFVSPVAPGERLFGVNRAPDVKAPADRLVFIVGDGLRADKAFQSFPEPYPETDEDLIPRPLAPFLRSRVLEHGTFGVSHTRVPTESRPGHVALIAGLYEDVSAVTTGWQLNPVNFDSVFNRSRHTWSWGSPDILPMFEMGAVPGRVDAFSYAAEDEDFSQGAEHLDHWVFDHVKEMFAEAATNETLNTELRKDKNVFFLHLIGIDTTGHSYRPYSKEYLHNIKIVDQGVKEITELIETFYNDDRTAFVFTADHGMSDWGSHGDGHPDNTRTPLIAWGSGIAKPNLFPGQIAKGHNEFSADWGMDHVQRHDVDQADVAALMAYLAGLDFPANSEGKLPLTYLAADSKEKAEASLVNAQGIMEMHRAKEAKKRNSQLRYRPYEPLSGTENGGGATADARIASIRALVDAGKYEEAIEESKTLIDVGLAGMRYIQTYDWLFLRVMITIGFLGWMAFALTTVVDLFVLHGQTQPSRSLPGTLGFSSVLSGLYASFVASKSPVSYYLYAFFPIFFWEEVFARRESLVQGSKALFGHIDTGASFVSLVFNVVVYVGIIVSLALAYIYREILTVLFILGAFWPATYGLTFLQKNLGLSVVWFASCLAMSSFTLLDALKVEDVNLIMIGGALMVAVGVVYLICEDMILAEITSRSRTKPAKNHVARGLVGAQIGLVILAMLVTRHSALSLQARTGLPRGSQIVGWLTLIISFLMPFAYRASPNNHYLHRLMVIFLTFAPTFVILTISYEGLFYIAYSATLLAWIRLEHEVYVFTSKKTAAKSHPNGNGSIAATPKTTTPATPSPTFRPLTLPDARIALFFFILLQSAFFSASNVASVSQFSLESVNRLLPVFDPFSQGALLMLKLLTPFALLSSGLGVLNLRLGVAPSALFMVCVAVCDVLTLYFFWVVRDEGSWLEIGSTISHFAIASLLSVFVAGLEGVSALFIAGVEVGDAVPGVDERVVAAVAPSPAVAVANGEKGKAS